MPEQKNKYYISTWRGTLIILLVAVVALGVFGFLYYYWIENPFGQAPAIFSLSRVAGVNLNANLKPYLSQNQSNKCQKDSDCASDAVCYTSQECKTINSNTFCGAEQGDLLCHQKCVSDSDCPVAMPKCTPTNFFVGENSILIKICQSS